jgi:hypothetical protein
MKFKPLNASLALAATFLLSAPAAAAIDLGTLGNYGIVELGSGNNVNINSGPNTGNVLVGQGATATSAGGGNGSIIGTVYTDNKALVNFTALQTPYPDAAEVLVSSAVTLQAFNDAVALSNFAAGLAPNQTIATINSATTFTCLTGGGCSQLVVNVGSIQNATITLVGDANSYFIFNITGSYATNKDVVLSGAVDPNHILWNLLGTSGNILQTSGGAGNCGQSATCLQGTFLATHGGDFQFSNLGLTGRLVNTGGNMQIVSGSAFNAPPSPVPEPTTWAMMLLGFGAIGASMRHRRRKALQTA